MWVTNSNGNSVTELSPCGETIGTYLTGNSPESIAFDGTNMWVVDINDDAVTELSPTGKMIGQYSVGPGLGAITFDDKNISILGDGVVTELSLGGVVKDTYSLGSPPVGLAFDGTNLWNPTQSSGIVKLPAGGGAAETYTAPVASGQAPTTIVFDGTNMWLGVRNVQSSLPSNTVFELSLSDVTIGTFVVGPDTFPMGFDGRHIFVTTLNGYESL